MYRAEDFAKGIRNITPFSTHNVRAEYLLTDRTRAFIQDRVRAYMPSELCVLPHLSKLRRTRILIRKRPRLFRIIQPDYPNTALKLYKLPLRVPVLLETCLRNLRFDAGRCVTLFRFAKY